MAYDRSVPGLDPLTPTQVEVLTACDRGEVWMPARDCWRNAMRHRHGHCGQTILSLARRGLAQEGHATDEWGRLPVQLTDGGQRVLKEVQSHG